MRPRISNQINFYIILVPNMSYRNSVFVKEIAYFVKTVIDTSGKISHYLYLYFYNTFKNIVIKMFFF